MSRHYAALRALIERYPEVQLATLVDTPPEGAQWLPEIKLDGYRLFGFISGDMLRLRTRNGNQWSERFPSLAAPLETLKAKAAVLDMEAVVLDSQGKSNFQALQTALGDDGHPNKIVAYVFDLLHLDGTDLTEFPLTERKQKLRSLLKQSEQETWLRYSEHVAGQAGRCLLRLAKPVSRESSQKRALCHRTPKKAG